MDTKNNILLDEANHLVQQRNDGDEQHRAVQYDRALELAGNGKFQIYAMIAIAMSIMVTTSEIHSMAFVLPAAKCDLHLTTAEQGFIYVVSYVGLIMTLFVWGFLADTWGRRKTLMLALSLTFVSSLLSAFSTVTWMLMLTRFICGLSLAALRGTGLAYLGEFLCDKIRPAYLSYLSSIVSSILVVQPLYAMAILTTGSIQWSIFDMELKPWRLFAIVNSLLPAIALFGFVMLPDSPKFLLATNREREARQILSSIFSINSGMPKDKYPVENVAALKLTGTNLNDVNDVGETLSVFWQQTKPLFMPPYLGDMIFLGVVSFLFMFVLHGQLLWFPQILSLYVNNGGNKSLTVCETIALRVQSKNTTTSESISAICDTSMDPIIFYTIIAMGISFSAINGLVGLGVGHYGKNRMIMLWLFGSVAAALAILWTKTFYLNAVLFIIYISATSCCNLIVGVFADLFPTHLRVMAINLNMMISRVGSIAGSNFVAALIYKQCNTLYTVNLVVLTISVLCTYRILKKCNRAGGI